MTRETSARRRGLEDVPAAVEPAGLLALGQGGAVAGGGEEGGDAGPAGPHALGHGALGVQLDLEDAVEELALEELVLADVAGDHLVDLAGLEEQAEPGPVDGRRCC